MKDAVIRLGAILSLSGEASQDAQGIRDGIELAVKGSRARGQEIAVEYVDDKSDVVSSVRAIEILVREHGISAIVGPTWAYQVDAFSPIIDQDKVLTFVPAVASDSVIRGSRYLLFGAEKNIHKQTTLKDFVFNHGVKKIGVILSQDKWGVSHLFPIKNVALQTGAEIVFIEQLIPYISSFGKQYIRETIVKALGTGPDLIIWSGYEGEADVLVDFLLEEKLSIPLIGDQMLVSGRRGEKLKRYDGELYFFSNHFTPEFSNLFEAEYNRNPSLYSDISYDATLLLADVISSHPSATSEEIIGIIKSKDYQFQGLSGAYVFDERGDVQSNGRWTIEKFEK
ncbi:MAG: ABC transporter substrate-binding protein [Candidatus Moranbacteria bacterium]|nr:ABC transporter substrate-binding protein [Candidatus Moranbacteria bacterium]